MERYEIPADIVLGTVDGLLSIHRDGDYQAIAVDADALLEVLALFLDGNSVDEALLTDGATSKELKRELIDSLIEAGVLRPAKEKASLEHRHVTPQLRSIAALAEQVNADIRAMGPIGYAAASESLGTAPRSILLRIQAELFLLRNKLRALQPEFSRNRVAELTTKGKLPRLHLGCGQEQFPDWYNIDFHPAELPHNLSWPLPFDDSSIEFIYLAHLLEHLYVGEEVPRLLSELERALKPGGVVRIVVPDAEQFMSAYVARDNDFFEMQKKVWHWWAPEKRTPLESILGYLGAPTNPAEFGEHRYGYDFETLELLLYDAGFSDVYRSSFMTSPHAELRLDEHSLVAHARVGDSFASLFVEAKK